ncbi:6-phosphogluconate dehydrogenase (decarboxylating) [Saccharococcus thermophilus]|uniref:6-phosphogluconate dehydrogenase (Decarboxylating) n=1 Tax=Saccharococcus thermophilus TaxID=29396 RepID=A0A846MKR7_9BACL|nr:6-phosphogluconate dehydrogenase (decarboxylating) [Saccharococcus thermophilus]
MRVGLIGLGKMGLNLGKNLIDHKHEVVAFDVNANAVEEIKKIRGQRRIQFKGARFIIRKPKNSLGDGSTYSC